MALVKVFTQTGKDPHRGYNPVARIPVHLNPFLGAV